MIPFTISLEAPRQRFVCRADQNLLSILRTPDQRRIRVGCHGGGCGVCKIRVREGQYEIRRLSRAHISVREEAERVTLACQTYPLSDLRIEPWRDQPVRLARRPGFMPLPIEVPEAGKSHDG